jgi:hypothetical protein
MALQVLPYNGLKPRPLDVTSSETGGMPWSHPTGSKNLDRLESKNKNTIVNIILGL